MPFAVHAMPRRALLLLTTVLALGFITACGKPEPTAEEVLGEAAVLQAEGRLGEAIALLEQYDQAHPGSLAVVEELAFAYVAADDPATAAMFFARAAEIDPSQAEYLLMAAEAWENAGDPETAISLYQQYLTLRPGDHTARLNLAERYREQGQVDAARDALLLVNREAPSGPVQVRIGQLFFEGNNLAQAQQWFRSAAQLEDEARDDALLGLVRVAVEAGRFDDAEQLVQVLEEESPGTLAQTPMADLPDQLAAWRARREAARTAASQISGPGTAQLPATAETAEPPTSTPSPTTREQTGVRTSETTGIIREGARPADRPAAEEAEIAGETVAEDDTAGAEEAGETPPPPDKEEMVAAAERTIPEAVPAAEGDEDEAAPTLFPADEPEAPIPATAVQGYAESLAAARSAAAAGRWAEAVRNYQRALARSSADPKVWSELSEAQYQLGDVQIAPSSASEAVRRAPNSPSYRLQYLRVLQAVAQPTRLLNEMEAARRDFPLNPDFALILARAHRDLGSMRFARRYFEEFLRLAAPDHPERATAEREMNQLP